MVSKANALVPVIYATLVLGCATGNVRPGGDLLANANYGPEVSAQKFEDVVRGSMKFYDPYSAVIKCDDPKKGWYGSKGWGMTVDKYYFGRMSVCKYNAKNRMGGYVGEKIGTFIISGGNLYDLTSQYFYGYAQ